MLSLKNESIALGLAFKIDLFYGGEPDRMGRAATDIRDRKVELTDDVHAIKIPQSSNELAPMTLRFSKRRLLEKAIETR
jgi:hypothetical protein